MCVYVCVCVCVSLASVMTTAALGEAAIEGLPHALQSLQLSRDEARG